MQTLKQLGGGVTVWLAAAALCVVALGGCTKERHAVIPADALLNAEGDKRITATARTAGTVYVDDKNDDRLVYSGEVDAGDIVTVDPERDEITVEDKVVATKILRKGHTHRIFFNRDPM